KGMFRMLKEAHVLFDVVEQERLADRLGELPAQVVLLPGIAELQPETLDALASWQRQGGRVFATGGALIGQPAAIAALFGASGVAYRLDETAAAYVRVDDPALFPALAGRE